LFEIVVHVSIERSYRLIFNSRPLKVYVKTHSAMGTRNIIFERGLHPFSLLDDPVELRLENRQVFSAEVLNVSLELDKLFVVLGLA
jgi:hypothetical protein